MENLEQQIEALIFTAEQSITVDEMLNCINSLAEEKITSEDINKVIEHLREKYSAENYSFEINQISGGYQFLTKKQYNPLISILLQQKSKKRLSTAAMETLAIIAYKQPITKAEVEHIRGVNSDYSVQKLLEKELIEISGKSEGPGKPVLYSTSKTFMDYFGINSPKELPQLKDIFIGQNEIGQQVE
jgi:segregation and condensation protein B